jgi:hypothetical protein
MDGQKQRQALGAAEQSVRALIAGDADRARATMARAVELDQVAAFDEAAPLVGGAADSLDATGVVATEQWSAIARALGPGPVGALAEQQASKTG